MGNALILEKFEEWVGRFGGKEARVKVFEQIRDIPYYLVPQIEDPLEWASSILKSHKGSCSPKHYLLGFLFGKLNIPVKYATYFFKWDSQPLRYTEELKQLSLGCPTGYHVACKASINNKWVLVDATWDLALGNAGFPVNFKWDGLSDTRNAVLPFEETVHESLEDRLNFVREKRKLFSEQEKNTYAEFIPKFNDWLAGLRR